MTDESSPAPAEIPTLPVTLKASRSHQILTLIGTGFVVFELIFLNFYFDTSWFGLDLRVYGIPVIIGALIIAHFLLTLGESKFACRLLSLIFKGKPVVVYKRWLELNEDGIAFGSRHVRYDAIDELELTLLGNLVFHSRVICGPKAPFPDQVLKVPFSVADFPTQEVFLATIRRRKPDYVLNKRLAVGRKAVLQKGAQTTQLFTAGIMALLLLDVGFGSFYFLDLIKNYYLAETDLLDGHPKDSEIHFSRAEDLRLHPLPFSWVSAKFLKSSNVAAGIWEQRSRVLWLQGKHDEAIEDGRKAVEESPTNLRHRLYQARLLIEENKIPEAKVELDKILEEHKHSFMPRLYMLAIAKEHETAAKLAQEYKTQLDACYEDTYEEEPHWPPGGGNRFFTELFYSDDSRFLLDRFLSTKYTPPPRTTAGAEGAEKK